MGDMTEYKLTAIDLAEAIRNGNVTIAERAIAQRIDPNQPAFDAAPLLLMAVENNLRGVIDLLLDAGADPSKANFMGFTPLMAAASNPALADLVGVLLDAGADPSPVSRRGDTALSLAVRTKNRQACEEMAAAAPLMFAHPVASDSLETLTDRCHQYWPDGKWPAPAPMLRQAQVVREKMEQITPELRTASVTANDVGLSSVAPRRR